VPPQHRQGEVRVDHRDVAGAGSMLGTRSAVEEGRDGAHEMRYRIAQLDLQVAVHRREAENVR
jgi:hypothetical protein